MNSAQEAIFLDLAGVLAFACERISWGIVDLRASPASRITGGLVGRESRQWIAYLLGSFPGADMLVHAYRPELI